MTRLRNVVEVLALSLCLVSRVMAAVATGPWEVRIFSSVSFEFAIEPFFCTLDWANCGSTNQGVFFWYAYRMDIEAFGKRDDMIAPLCPGSRSDGTCKFDEFFAYVQNDANALDPNQKTSIGDSLWPDPETATKELGKLTQNGGNPFNAKYDPLKLFQSGKFQSNEGLASMLQEATNKAQAARTKLGDDSDKIKTGLTQAREALAKTQQMRLEATARGNELVNALEDFKKDQGLSFKVEYDSFTSPDGWTGKLINMNKMAGQSDWEKNWKDYQAWIDTKKNKKKFGYLVTARLHKNALVGIQDQAARLHGPSSC